MKGDARLAFRVSRLAFGVWRSASKGTGGKANGRHGEWAIVVATDFEDEDEEDGVARGWRSLITFGYSGDVQVPHRKGVERRFFLTGKRLR